MNKLIILICFIFSLLSCTKADERSCLKKSGDSTKLILTPGEFKRIYLKEHIDYVMVQDTINYVIIEGGENLVGFIDCSIIDNELVISNKNKCNFLRYKTSKVTVEIHFKTIENLVFQGTGFLTNRNIWNFNQMNIILKDAGGTMKINNLQGSTINLINTHGWGDIYLAGNVNYFRADLDGNGYFDSRNFHVEDSISVISNSSTISKLNADNCSLKAQLNATGDLWYFGNPSNIWKQELGTGRVIDKN
jgi:hypothetical protein